MRRLRETSLVRTYVRPLLQQYKPRKALLLRKQGIEKQLGQDKISKAMGECKVKYLGAKTHPTIPPVQKFFQHI